MAMTFEDFKKEVTDNQALTVFQDYIATSIYPHMQAEEMMKQGVEPPQRMAAPGEDDTTLTEIRGD